MMHSLYKVWMTYLKLGLHCVTSPQQYGALGKVYSDRLHVLIFGILSGCETFWVQSRDEAKVYNYLQSLMEQDDVVCSDLGGVVKVELLSEYQLGRLKTNLKQQFSECLNLLRN